MFKIYSMRLFFSLAFIGSFCMNFAQTYKLPALPYDYSAYEPYIDAQTMHIHHGKHHQAYVDNLNKAITGTRLDSISLTDLLLNASFRSDAVKNNAGGHYNHGLFWEILVPNEKQTDVVHAEFDQAVKTQLGGFDSLKIKLIQAATSRFGSGWAWLIVTPDKKLKITSTANQENPIMDVAKERGIPIAGIDVWEHAYYLKYQNKRADYLNAVYDLIDWGIVSDKYIATLKDPLLTAIEKDNWPALKDFHRVMGQTFHPAENGNLTPLRTRASELAAKSTLLRASQPPVSLDKPAIKEALLKLEKQCKELEKLSTSKVKNDVLIKKITAAHDTFHLVQGLCHD